MSSRAERQSQLDTRVANIRAAAASKQAKADAIYGSVNDDPAFWTQPAYGNAAGRAFAARRDRERNRMRKAAELAGEAKELREKADRMERTGVVMAGDTAAAREAEQAAVEVAVGQLVNTTFYGVRRVLKVNKKTVLVEGGTGPLKVEKHMIYAAA